jgi:hypothetical protein
MLKNARDTCYYRFAIGQETNGVHFKHLLHSFFLFFRPVSRFFTKITYVQVVNFIPVKVSTCIQHESAKTGQSYKTETKE